MSSFEWDPVKYHKIVTFPIPIQTNRGVIHLYCKSQIPIIGTNMTGPRFAVMIVTETKKYCGFLSEKEYEIKNYEPIYAHGITPNGLNFKESGTRKLTEDKLIICPSKCMRPFNMIENNDSPLSIISIDYVSFPKLCAESIGWHINHLGKLACHGPAYDDSNTSGFYECKDSRGNFRNIRDKLIGPFQLKVYEYDSYDQETEIIDMNTFEKNPKLEFMLKKLWKVEQGFDNIPLKPRGESHGEPPKYDDEDLNIHLLTKK